MDMARQNKRSRGNLNQYYKSDERAECFVIKDRYISDVTINADGTDLNEISQRRNPSYPNPILFKSLKKGKVKQSPGSSSTE